MQDKKRSLVSVILINMSYEGGLTTHPNWAGGMQKKGGLRRLLRKLGKRNNIFVFSEKILLISISFLFVYYFTINYFTYFICDYFRHFHQATEAQTIEDPENFEFRVKQDVNCGVNPYIHALIILIYLSVG